MKSKSQINTTNDLGIRRAIKHMDDELDFSLLELVKFTNIAQIITILLTIFGEKNKIK